MPPQEIKLTALFVLMIGALWAMFATGRSFRYRSKSLRSEVEKEMRFRTRLFGRIVLFGVAAVVLFFTVVICLHYLNPSLSYRMVLAQAMMLGVLVILLTVVMLPFLWGFSRVTLEGGLLHNAGVVLRKLRFQTWQIMAVVTIAAIIAGSVRACYPDESPWFWAALTLIGLMLTAPMLAVAYLGIDTLFFGRGSGARINRLREVEAKRKMEDLPDATYLSDRPPHGSLPTGPVPPKVSVPKFRPGRKSDKSSD